MICEGDKKTNASLTAMRDWLRDGEFNNKYTKGSAEYFAYSDEQYRIELVNDLNNELIGGFKQ